MPGWKYRLSSASNNIIMPAALRQKRKTYHISLNFVWKKQKKKKKKKKHERKKKKNKALRRFLYRSGIISVEKEGSAPKEKAKSISAKKKKKKMKEEEEQKPMATPALFLCMKRSCAFREEEEGVSAAAWRHSLQEKYYCLRPVALSYEWGEEGHEKESRRRKSWQCLSVIHAWLSSWKRKRHSACAYQKAGIIWRRRRRESGRRRKSNSKHQRLKLS